MRAPTFKRLSVPSWWEHLRRLAYAGEPCVGNKIRTTPNAYMEHLLDLLDGTYRTAYYLEYQERVLQSLGILDSEYVNEFVDFLELIAFEVLEPNSTTRVLHRYLDYDTRQLEIMAVCYENVD